jgi:hypothetical protein
MAVKTLLLICTWCALLCGCATGPRANLRTLHNRAIFDLGCPAQQVQIYHLDNRSKVVMGCGRRLVYVEDCFDHGAKRECTWVNDTPSFAQQAWPQTYNAQMAVRGRTPRFGTERAIRTQLFPAGQEPSVAQPAAPLESPPATTAPRGRVFRTDLYRNGTERTDPKARTPRRVRTELYDEDPTEQPDVLEYRH